MLDINIYGNYKIHIKYEHSYISQEDSTPDDIVFKEESGEQTITKNGGDFLKCLANEMKNSCFQRLNIKNNIIIVELFNPNTGGNGTYIYEIEEVKQC